MGYTYFVALFCPFFACTSDRPATLTYSSVSTYIHSYIHGSIPIGTAVLYPYSRILLSSSAQHKWVHHQCTQARWVYTDAGLRFSSIRGVINGAGTGYLAYLATVPGTRRVPGYCTRVSGYPVPGYEVTYRG